jgi:hypothetical protein
MFELIIDTATVSESEHGCKTGIEWKVLRRGDRGEPLTILLKLPPGFVMTTNSRPTRRAFGTNRARKGASEEESLPLRGET